MKLSFAFMALVLFSCNDQSLKTDINDVKTLPEVRNCYQYAGNRDIIVLNLISKGDSVKGSLSYSLYQKDNSIGTIQGKMKGDLLIADYTFQSEGITSVRQVAFKQRGASFIEGYGEVSNEGNRTVFKDINSLNFGHSGVLMKVFCK